MPLLRPVPEAQLGTSSETVNPIPPSSDTPKLSIHVTELFSFALVAAGGSQTVPRIPTGWPATSAVMIPRVMGFMGPPAPIPPKGIPAAVRVVGPPLAVQRLCDS